MVRKVPEKDRFYISFEIGQYYMGYENPETITDHE